MRILTLFHNSCYRGFYTRIISRALPIPLYPRYKQPIIFVDDSLAVGGPLHWVTMIKKLTPHMEKICNVEQIQQHIQKAYEGEKNWREYSLLSNSEVRARARVFASAQYVV